MCSRVLWHSAVPSVYLSTEHLPNATQPRQHNSDNKDKQHTEWSKTEWSLTKLSRRHAKKMSLFFPVFFFFSIIKKK